MYVDIKISRIKKIQKIMPTEVAAKLPKKRGKAGLNSKTPLPTTQSGYIILNFINSKQTGIRSIQ